MVFILIRDEIVNIDPKTIEKISKSYETRTKNKEKHTTYYLHFDYKEVPRYTNYFLKDSETPDEVKPAVLFNSKPSRQTFYYGEDKDHLEQDFTSLVRLLVKEEM